MSSTHSTFKKGLILFNLLILVISQMYYSIPTIDETSSIKDFELNEEENQSQETWKWQVEFSGGLDGQPLECEHTETLKLKLAKTQGTLKTHHTALIDFLEALSIHRKVTPPFKSHDMNTPLTWLFEKQVQHALFSPFPPATLQIFQIMQEYETQFTKITTMLTTYFQMIEKVVQSNAGSMLPYYQWTTSSFHFQFQPSLFILKVHLPQSFETCINQLSHIYIPAGLSVRDKNWMTLPQQRTIRTQLEKLIKLYFRHRFSALDFFILNQWSTLCSSRSSSSLVTNNFKETTLLPSSSPLPQPPSKERQEPLTAPSIALDPTFTLTLPFSFVFPVHLEQQLLTLTLRKHSPSFICDSRHHLPPSTQLKSLEKHIADQVHHLKVAFLTKPQVRALTPKASSTFSVAESTYHIIGHAFFHLLYSNLPMEFTPFIHELETNRKRIGQNLIYMQWYFQTLQKRSSTKLLHRLQEENMNEPFLKVHGQNLEKEWEMIQSKEVPFQLTIQYLPIFPKDFVLKLQKQMKSSFLLLSKLHEFRQLIVLHNQLQATYFEYLLVRAHTNYCNEKELKKGIIINTTI